MQFYYFLLKRAHKSFVKNTIKERCVCHLISHILFFCYAFSLFEFTMPICNLSSFISFCLLALSCRHTFCSGEWENGCNELQRMLIVRCLRQDRVSFCVTSFIINSLGSRFVEPPVLDMKAVSKKHSSAVRGSI